MKKTRKLLLNSLSKDHSAELIFHLVQQLEVRTSKFRMSKSLAPITLLMTLQLRTLISEKISWSKLSERTSFKQVTLLLRLMRSWILFKRCQHHLSKPIMIWSEKISKRVWEMTLIIKRRKLRKERVNMNTLISFEQAWMDDRIWLNDKLILITLIKSISLSLIIFIAWTEVHHLLIEYRLWVC